MRAAFLGTPAAAVPSLAALADVVDVALVVTRPDAARGRSSQPAPPPIKTAARAWGYPVAQPADAASLLAALRPLELDLAVVVAYGRILDAETLATTRLGFVNVHFSLLPRWRGAAPVEHAILAGDAVTGVSLMRIDEGLDTGPVISVIETPIADDETGGSLSARLSYLGAKLLDDSLPGFLNGTRDPARQIDAAATYAPRLTKREAQITVEVEADVAVRMVRAYSPRPGAWILAGGDRYRIGSASASDIRVPPGRVAIDNGRPILGLRGGSIRIDSIQAPGKRMVSGAAWANGRRGEGLALDRP